MNTFSFYILGVVEGDTNDLTSKIEWYKRWKATCFTNLYRIDNLWYLYVQLLSYADVKNYVIVIEC